jgi:hypothetical protein
LAKNRIRSPTRIEVRRRPKLCLLFSISFNFAICVLRSTLLISAACIVPLGFIRKWLSQGTRFGSAPEDEANKTAVPAAWLTFDLVWSQRILCVTIRPLFIELSRTVGFLTILKDCLIILMFVSEQSPPKRFHEASLTKSQHSLQV